MTWINEFKERLDGFEKQVGPRDGEVAVSIKVRVEGGCYGRDCCPYAFGIIDGKLRELQTGDTRFCFEEHETGPEIIALVLLTTAGVNLV